MLRSFLSLAKREFAKPYVFGEAKSSAGLVGNLFSPESLGEKELALGLNRLVNMEMATGEISERYCSRVVEISSQMKSRDIAMLLNSLAKISGTSEAVQSLVKLLPSRLMHFTPLEISLVLNALAKLSIKDEKLLQKFAAEIPHKLEIFAEDNFAQTVHALARLGFVNDALLVSEFSSFFRSRAGNFDAQQLFMIAGAFARFKSPEIFPVLISRTREVLDALQPHQGPLIAMAAASVQARGGETEQFAEEISGKISDVKHAALFLSALAKLDLMSERFGWSRLLKKISDQPPSEAATVVQIFHALGRRGVCDPEISKRLVEISVLPLVEKFDANQLAMVAYALGNLNTEIPKKLEIRLTSLLAGDAEMGGPALAMASFSLARKSERLAHFLARRLQGKIRELSAKSLGMVLRGFSGKFPEKLKQEVKVAVHAHAITDALSAEEARGLVDGVKIANVEISEDERLALVEKTGKPHRRDRILDAL